jgi:hypothetical protein
VVNALLEDIRLSFDEDWRTCPKLAATSETQRRTLRDAALPARLQLIDVVKMRTLSVGLLCMAEHEVWGHYSAGVILSTVPVALLFSYLKRHFIHRLTAGAVNGLVGRRPMSR